ncbi:MAG TPA: MbtH family NRPS accessory protein [Azospirillum sp.]|nr:MbtH family NRPS accessory protein [Azospirillum sp.]
MGQEQSSWQDGQVKVVINDEEQYALWPDNRPLPAGWRETGKAGDRNDCLTYISEVWQDMRPRSIR